ncbi:MarR family transcriptional regulator [Streptomyces dangxiongensis]|uniref:MarR family transcriptional regulator n=2 Tax=Streptomyces dangxiongensis TaxID=1442032 RepID=A0A3G2JK20_9ACTN|nr:MarR family transcriptional regulator [Streptomyces dangxiongensis]
MEERWANTPEVNIAPLSPSQLRVLYTLEDHDGTNLRTLARTLSITSAAVSQLCDRIEAAGFLERVPNPHNRREVQVQLTGSGRTYLERLRSERRQALTPIIEALPSHDRAALLDGLTALAAATTVAR